jgi:cytochrome bd ubiquinol oxidase subunit II
MVLFSGRQHPDLCAAGRFRPRRRHVVRSDVRRAAALRHDDVLAPVWDGNETWLIVSGVELWNTFPVVCSTLMSACYPPVLLMLAGLILRGMAFEFRHRTEWTRWLWDASFVGGSLVATFMQGVMVGALVEGFRFSNGRYVGGLLGWVKPFALPCGVGLCVGYALLGACWPVSKYEAEVREAAYRLIPCLSAALLVFLVVMFIYRLVEDLPVMARWLDRLYLLIFPMLGALAAITLAAGVRLRRDAMPFPMVVVIFAAAFCTLGISFWP